MTIPVPPWPGGSGARTPLWGWPNGREPSCYEPRDSRLLPLPDRERDVHDLSVNGRGALSPRGSRGCPTTDAPAGGRFVPPAVALSVVKLACARPDGVGRSWSPGDSVALARQVVRDGGVETLSPQPVPRMLAHHTLKPWRPHRWLSPTGPREAAFAAQGPAMVPW
jgi:hypothetical protein